MGERACSMSLVVTRLRLRYELARRRVVPGAWHGVSVGACVLQRIGDVSAMLVISIVVYGRESVLYTTYDSMCSGESTSTYPARHIHHLKISAYGALLQ